MSCPGWSSWCCRLSRRPEPGRVPARPDGRQGLIELPLVKPGARLPAGAAKAARPGKSAPPSPTRAPPGRPPRSAPGAGTGSAAVTSAGPGGSGARAAGWPPPRRGRATSSSPTLTRSGTGPRRAGSPASATRCSGAPGRRWPTACTGSCRRGRCSTWAPATGRWSGPSGGTAGKRPASIPTRPAPARTCAPSSSRTWTGAWSAVIFWHSLEHLRRPVRALAARGGARRPRRGPGRRRAQRDEPAGTAVRGPLARARPAASPGPHQPPGAAVPGRGPRVPG